MKRTVIARRPKADEAIQYGAGSGDAAESSGVTGSQGIAGLLVLAALLFLPPSAHAANECAPAGSAPSDNGSAADTYTCSGSYNATGISYSSAGDLTLNANTGAINTGAFGINLTGNGTDSVSFLAAPGTGAIAISLSGPNFSNAALHIVSGGDTTVSIAAGRSLQWQNSSSGSSVRGRALDLATAGAGLVQNDGTIVGGIRLAGAGNWTFNNNGNWTILTDSELGAATFNNAGTIRFSTLASNGNAAQEANSLKALAANFEVVSAQGGTFTGSGASKLEMGVLLNGSGQRGCGALSVGDCLDLSGGSTAGQTAIRVITATPSGVNSPLALATSANPGIVLVDVSGGTSHAGDFVLSPDSDHYAADPIYGAVLDFGGLLDYTLLYDAGAQQHLLASVPTVEAVQYTGYIDEALSVWHTTADAVAGRQADLRNGATGKVWVRVIGDQTSRDATPTFAAHGNRYEYDQHSSTYTSALIVGFDAASGDDHVIGAHIGLVNANADFRDSATSDKLEGATAGLYAGWWKGNLTLDGTLNVNALSLDHDVAALEKTKSDVLSIGARAEAGWRLPLAAEAFYLQPLLTAAYVRADIDKLALKDNDVSFDNADSLRGAVGLRLGGDTALKDSARVGYWLTVRAWNEFADDGQVRFATQDGSHLAIKDDISGAFQEYAFGLSVANAKDTISAFLSGGAQVGNDADHYSVSLGARLRW